MIITDLALLNWDGSCWLESSLLGSKHLSYLLHEMFSVEILVRSNLRCAIVANSKIFGHASCFNGIDHRCFQIQAKFGQGRVVVKLRSVSKTSCPRKNTCNWVCGSWFTLLVLAPVASDSTYKLVLSSRSTKTQGDIKKWEHRITMSSFCFNNLTPWS